MGPDQALPLTADFQDVDAYIKSLLQFVTSSTLLRTLCGGVHIRESFYHLSQPGFANLRREVDFFTRTPDLYSQILPESWRKWFTATKIEDILDLLMREDLRALCGVCHENAQCINAETRAWRGGPLPPLGLLEYAIEVRRHCLDRIVPGGSSKPNNTQDASVARRVALGMTAKKNHEVQHLAQYVDNLVRSISSDRRKEITHLVDFGSGQNYLGRALASQPYNKRVIAVESKTHNIEGAKNMDVLAKLSLKPKILRNKKVFRAQQEGKGDNASQLHKNDKPDRVSLTSDRYSEKPSLSQDHIVVGHSEACIVSQSNVPFSPSVQDQDVASIQYIEHKIENGDVRPVIEQIHGPPSSWHAGKLSKPSAAHDGDSLVNQRHLTTKLELKDVPSLKLMTISLHSCGNLLHHGLRSLVLNDEVAAVCLVGCCYNLMAERLGPPTYKLPTLRPRHPRLEGEANACDPHGFPMSDRLADYPLPNGEGKGIRLNITARMMAVQAPQNWGPEDSERFFTRHFYRALLQRIFLDRGVVQAPSAADDVVGKSSAEGGTQPIIIGSLRKACYTDFVSYVRGAIAKLSADASHGSLIKDRMGSITDNDIKLYAETYAERKKELSVVWSLMAFSAGVLESLIVVDRWLWLKEQPQVKDCWVEPVFQYKLSPRNLVIVGIKK